jgi:hypothetical protein
MTARTFILTAGAAFAVAVPTANAATASKRPAHGRNVHRPLVSSLAGVPPTPWAHVIGLSEGAPAAVVKTDVSSPQVDGVLLTAAADDSC